MADKNSEEQLRKSQKIETIERLTGRVAHDLNHLLTTILDCSERELARLPDDDKSSATCKEINTATQRAVGLAQQLLALSRSQSIEPKAINLNNPIIKMGRMLRRLLSDKIELVTTPGSGLDLVEVDPGQIEQVILNLAVNASDAMPKGGKLAIDAQSITLDDEHILQHSDGSPGDHVVLSFTDNGRGMTATEIDRIFEPFFTTKEDGESSGLGLSTCYAIVSQNGGHIAVASQEGQGSTFQAYLPAVRNATPAAQREDEFTTHPQVTKPYSWWRTSP